ncbi:tRNA dihydrouridine(20/20a) synthase DusA [Acidimangrovimonas sediminis]|uniref:tRNA dihydrouridine(20/20a) synthase DusA n=1 Tax=Acidimangrovimonas sediminis TaxID=2056283 RepID=UPI000C7F8C4A|nr:tRNA dihydrouridine(20/20a) synthase DusA [Acidimangrovimonas sediminis]
MAESKMPEKQGVSALHDAARLSVAPMMDWTDRHCRVFHRMLSRQALLYTEMVTAPAVIHGDRDRLLGYDALEHPVALQLGGSDPAELAQATRIAAAYGYDEINLNVGCPSDRVQSGCFGAVLMQRPQLVAECVAAMIAESPVEVTVKCRIGVDEQVPEEVLPAFLETVRAAGVTRFTIHARKAWLQGLSPKENRDIPPLDYDLVLQMKQAFPDLNLSINGGITSLDAVEGFLEQGMDGVMLGRAAYHDPGSVLIGADRRIWGDAREVSRGEAVGLMRPYIADHVGGGGRLHQVTRHMLGLFHGQPGARGWRRVLSERAHGIAAGDVAGALGVLDAALGQVAGAPAQAAG